MAPSNLQERVITLGLNSFTNPCPAFHTTWAVGTIENRLFMAATQPNPTYVRWLLCALLCPRGWRWRFALSRWHHVARCPWKAGSRALSISFDKHSCCCLTAFISSVLFEIILSHFWVIHQQRGLCLTLHPDVQGYSWWLLITHWSQADPGTCPFLISVWIPSLY